MPYRRRSTVTVAMLAMSIALSACAIAVEAQELNRLRRLTVVDANGKTVGAVISLGGLRIGIDPSDLVVHPNSLNRLPTVALRVNGVVLTLQVLQNRFAGNVVPYFESADCSGTPLFAADDGSEAFVPLQATAITGSGSTVYVPNSTGGSQTVTVHSAWEQRGSCWNPGSRTMGVWPGIPVIDLATRFAPPFIVR